MTTAEPYIVLDRDLAPAPVRDALRELYQTGAVVGYHGTRRLFDPFARDFHLDDFEGGAMHVGTKTQARMKGPHLIHVKLRPTRVAYLHDWGGFSEACCTDLLADGYDAFVYLNRFEGIGPRAYTALMSNPSEASDDEFLYAFPEAAASWGVLHPSILYRP